MATDLPVVRVVTCGSVDDGKSTLLGRLLAETGSATADQLEYARRTRRGGSTIPAGEVDFSLITDGLEAEHEQGITIDVAYRHMFLPDGRRLIIADAPGHEQYTRNMAVAASTADVALLLVDATRGVRLQTHRHITVCTLMGVRRVIAVVNKMDAVGYQQAVFEELASILRTTAERLAAEDVVVIPVSALAGDNVMVASNRMAWYHGPALLEALSERHSPPPRGDRSPPALRLPVQFVIRVDGFRGYAGTVTAGRVQPGDPLLVASTGQPASVDQLLIGGRPADSAQAGQPVVVVLNQELDISRGDVLIAAEDLIESEEPATAFTADLVWTGEAALMHGRSYLLQVGPRTVPVVITAVRGRRNVETGEQLAARTLDMNDVGTVELSTDIPISLDRYDTCHDTGGFLLIDRVSGDTVAAGLVRHPLRRGRNVVPHDFSIDRQARARLKAQRPVVLWLTGLPGAGKSTVADALERTLHKLGVHTYVLDGDNVRSGLNKDLGFTPEDRAENVRRVAEVARLMFDAGLVVIVALVSPFRADRETARALFGAGDFVEVFVDAPAEVCAQRDPKGLYARARVGAIPNMTGMGQRYEAPEHPDVRISGVGELDDSVATLVELITQPQLSGLPLTGDIGV